MDQQGTPPQTMILKSYHTNAPRSNYKHSWDKSENWKFQKRNGRYKEEPKENFRTEKYNN